MAECFAMEKQCLETTPPAFQWPEPVIIDVINDVYRNAINPIDRVLIVKLQHRALRAIFEGDITGAISTRRELNTSCAARGITPQQIAQADRKVFQELIFLVSVQCRTSPRRRAAVSSRLHVALGRLALPEEPVAKPAYVMLRPRRLMASQAA